MGVCLRVWVGVRVCLRVWVCMHVCLSMCICDFFFTNVGKKLADKMIHRVKDLHKYLHNFSLKNIDRKIRIDNSKR